jgi:hypothetical protein
MYDERPSRIAVLLALLSPFYLFMCSSFMSHVSALLLIKLVILCLIKACKRPEWYFPFIAGLSFGLAFNTKPFPAILITAPFFFYGALQLCRRTVGIRNIVLFCIPALIMFALFFCYNHVLTGNFLTTGYDLYDPHSGLGFGPDKGEFSSFLHEGHTIAKGLKNTFRDFIVLSLDLFGWSGLSLMFLPVFFISQERNRWSLYLSCSIFLVAAGYFFYWGIGICFGARHFFECIPMFLILTARGIIVTPGIIKKHVLKGWQFELPEIKRAMGLFVICLCILNIANYFPGLLKTYGTSYWNVDSALHQMVLQKNFKKALVFVQSGTYRKPHTEPDYYNAAFIYNTPDLDGDVVYARDLGMSENRKLVAQYPLRQYYIFSRKPAEKGILKELNY